MATEIPESAERSAIKPDPHLTGTEVNTDAEENTPSSVKEIGGVKGPEPTRYGDWEKNGRCIDF